MRLILSKVVVDLHYSNQVFEVSAMLTGRGGGAQNVSTLLVVVVNYFYYQEIFILEDSLTSHFCAGLALISSRCSTPPKTGRHTEDKQTHEGDTLVPAVH